MSVFKDTPQRVTTSVAILLLLGACYSVDAYLLHRALCIPLLVIITGTTAYLHEWPRLNVGVTPMLWMLLGALYLLPACSATLWLWLNQPLALLWLVLLTVGADIGAYFAGRLIGGAKLWPAVSPGKTRSGALGGVGVAAVLGLTTGHWLNPMPAYPQLVLLSVVLAVGGIAGDLFESWLKRKAGVKDSSNLLPGHGGLLDRLDSHLVVIPLGLALLWGIA